MARLVWLLLVLLLWGGTVVATSTSDAAAPVATADARDAVEQGGSLNDDERSAPFDVDDDDDDGDDQDNALAPRTTVLAPSSVKSRSIASFTPRVRASSGHPHGLEEPPRS